MTRSQAKTDPAAFLTWPPYSLPGIRAMRHPVSSQMLEGRPGVKLRGLLSVWPLWRLLPYALLALWMLGLPYLCLLTISSGPLSFTFLAQALFSLAVVLGCIWWLFRRPAREFLNLSQLQAGQIWFSQEQFRTGSPLYLHYQRTLRQPLPADGWGLARLTCAEVSIVRSGTTLTFHHTVLWQRTFDPAPLYAGQTTLTAHWNTDLPAELPPSHLEGNNLVVWQLEVREMVPEFITLTSDYVLRVEKGPRV